MSRLKYQDYSRFGKRAGGTLYLHRQHPDPLKADASLLRGTWNKDPDWHSEKGRQLTIDIVPIGFFYFKNTLYSVFVSPTLVWSGPPSPPPQARTVCLKQYFLYLGIKSVLNLSLLDLTERDKAKTDSKLVRNLVLNNWAQFLVSYKISLLP
jgi:hypothetical protein